jgi:transcription-repair coupling factor (superfamily II helicase)
VEELFAYARLRRLAEEVGVISIDKTADGIAIKFGEKARISPEKLRILVGTRARATFTPSGVLRMDLSEEEADGVLRVAREALLELRLED